MTNIKFIGHGLATCTANTVVSVFHGPIEWPEDITFKTISVQCNVTAWVSSDD